MNELKKTWDELQKGEKKQNNISEWSYQRFSDFFNQPQFKDPEFNEKLSKIYNLSEKDKVENLDYIAEESGCTFDELLLKIMYLKNKRKIGDLYVDKVDRVIRECLDEDKKLLDKHAPFLYSHHYQPR